MRRVVAAVVLVSAACRPSPTPARPVAGSVPPTATAPADSLESSPREPAQPSCGYGETTLVTFAGAELEVQLAELSIAVIAMDNWSCSETTEGGDVCMDLHAQVAGASTVVNVCIVSPELEPCDTFVRIVRPTERDLGLDVRWVADSEGGQRLEFGTVDTRSAANPR